MDKQQYKEAVSLFKGYLYDNEVTELNTYPLYHNIYKHLMLPSKENLCFSSAFIVLLVQLSRPLNFFKFYIDLSQESNKPKVPMNVYGINILKSGGGKGLTNNIMKGLLDFEYTKREFINQMGEDIIDRGNFNEDEKKNINKNINKLRNVANVEEQASASTAGMRLMNENYLEIYSNLGLIDKEDKWVGSAFFNLQEMADSLENANSYDKDFFSTLKEMYDLGEFSAKALKTGMLSAIRQFYISFLGATTDKTLQNNPEVSRLLNNFFISGHARRSLVSMPSDKEFNIVSSQQKNTDGMSLRELFEAKKFVESEDVIQIRKQIKNNICRFASMARKGEKAIKLSDECYFYYMVYKMLCAERAKDVNSGILELEVENRFWKALKISGILALYDGAFNITPDYFCEAVKIVEYYSHHFRRFLNNRVTDVNDKIVELLLDSKKDGKLCGITNLALRTNNEVNSYRKENVTSGDFIKKAMKDVEEVLDKIGYQLFIDKKGYRGKTIVYAAIPNDWENPKMSDDEPYYVWDDVPKGEY